MSTVVDDRLKEAPVDMNADDVRICKRKTTTNATPYLIRGIIMARGGI
jgi:hypothetical protein